MKTKLSITFPEFTVTKRKPIPFAVTLAAVKSGKCKIKSKAKK
jgi:hypothetical protein